MIATIAPKNKKRHSKKFRKIYQASSDRASKALPARVPAKIPVFQLPHNDLVSIPEEAEIHRGFIVNMTTQPHRTRIYSGLLSMSNPDKRAIEQSATTAVEYRSYECLKTIDKALAILAGTAWTNGNYPANGNGECQSVSKTEFRWASDMWDFATVLWFPRSGDRPTNLWMVSIYTAI